MVLAALAATVAPLVMAALSGHGTPNDVEPAQLASWLALSMAFLATTGAGLVCAEHASEMASRRISAARNEAEKLHRRAERARRDANRFKASHTRVQDAVDSIADGFIFWDENDRLAMWNRSVSRALGRHVDLLRIGMPFDDYLRAIHGAIDPHFAGSENAWVSRRTAQHRKAAGSQEILMASGEWVQISERRTESGGTVSTYMNITDRKRVQNEISRRERRLAHAQRLARVGTWEWVAETNETFWSREMYDIVGLPADTPPLGFDQYLLLVHPANRDLARSTHQRLLRHGGQFNQEYQIIRPDGEQRTLRTEAEAILDDRGNPVRVIGAVHDLTELKRVERALRKAKDSADQANRAKSAFLANVSHELRTPLNAIIGFSEVMLQEIFGALGNERYREYAADIRQSGTHLLGVINDLLDYSKLEAGHLELHPERVSIKAVIEKCVRLMSERAIAEKVYLTSELEDDLPDVLGEDRKITQILLNLISNAIKFTPEQGEVSVSALRSGLDIEICVTDTGVGMSEADIKVALAPFGQIDNSANREHTGTGLGLPLSKSLAELHGGSLGIESTPGSGTTIRVLLPIGGATGGDTADGKPPLQLVIG